jgi:conjugal transfer/entry exclusion protein
MWPKALMQLIELAPHVTRLVPMADRYLQSKTDGGKAQRRALDEMGERLRGDLALTAERTHGDFTRVTAAQEGIVQQLTKQNATLESLAAELQAARLKSDAVDERMARMETRSQRLWMALVGGLIVFAGVVAVFAVLLLRR